MATKSWWAHLRGDYQGLLDATVARYRNELNGGAKWAANDWKVFLRIAKHLAKISGESDYEEVVGKICDLANLKG